MILNHFRQHPSSAVCQKILQFETHRAPFRQPSLKSSSVSSTDLNQSSHKNIRFPALVGKRYTHSQPQFICFYSAFGPDANLKRSSVGLITVVLAYLLRWLGKLVYWDTLLLSHSKHLIFPRYHCWYSCNGNNSIVVGMLLIAWKHCVRHPAQ